MKLKNKDLRVLCQLALEAATEAGQYIAQHRPSDIEYKDAGSSDASQVVTEVDHKSQSIILKKLESSLAKYDLGLLTEESEDNGSRLLKDHFWCIDPLDGTLPFVEGRAGYAVAISLISHDGKSKIGVMYDPTQDNCYSSFEGGGSFLNGEPYALSKEKSKELIIFHHRSIMKQLDFNDIIHQQTVGTKHKSIRLVSHGGAVMNAVWNLMRRPSIYFAFPKPTRGGGCIWDYAASVCFYKELGLSATDYYGDELNLNPDETVYMNELGVRFSNL